MRSTEPQRHSGRWVMVDKAYSAARRRSTEGSSGRYRVCLVRDSMLFDLFSTAFDTILPLDPEEWHEWEIQARQLYALPTRALGAMFIRNVPPQFLPKPSPNSERIPWGAFPKTPSVDHFPENRSISL